MKSKQTMFFLVLEDILPILKEIEKSIDLRYYESGLLDYNNIPNYDSILTIPDIGFVASGDWNRIDDYLVMKKNVSLHVRNVPQRAGGIKYAVDQLINEKSVTIKLGGIYKEVADVIVAGRVATASEVTESIELFEIFSRKIKKQFKKIGMFYVGKTAEEKLRQGWRLVTNEKASKEYDLAFS